MSILNFFRKRVEKVESGIETNRLTNMLFEKLLDVFGRRDSTDDLVGDNKRWREYTDKRSCWATYDINCERSDSESYRATKKNTKKFIGQLLNLGKALSEVEILGLAMLMDEIDYCYSCGILIHPFPIEDGEDKVFGNELRRMVNSLTRDYNIDPFELEAKLKELYYSLESRALLPSYMYVVGAVSRMEIQKRA